MQPVPASKTRVESAPILPVGGAPFALHVVLAEGEAAAGGPFLLLSEEEDAARVYLAVVKGDDDSVVDFAALKLTPNAYAPSLSPDAALHNPELEARWTAEASCLRRLTEASASVPRSLRPGGEIGERFPPLLFCRVERRFFTPPCPKCGAPLATCRDDARLAAAGLPLYSASRERFLSCASCSGKDGPATFYAFEPPPDVPEGAVSSAQDLYRDLGEALAGSDESSPPVSRFSASRFPSSRSG